MGEEKKTGTTPENREEETKEQQPSEEQKHIEDEKLPLDAKLLSEAVIELNISRRSVGLYPPGHAFITSAIDRAFGLLQKLFDIRKNITLGIARNQLVIDEYSLDPRNPVYIEVAESFHDKGIAGLTFFSGLTREELTGLHELLTIRNAPSGEEFAELAREKGLNHIKLEAIDYSSFRFVEGSREGGKVQGNIWEDYVYGLISGRLTSDEVSGVILKASPEEIADLINQAARKRKSIEGTAEEGMNDEAYDRVITSYLSSKGKSKLRPNAANKLFKLIDNLNPDLKNQFLSRTFEQISADTSQAETMLTGMSQDKLEETIQFLNKHASMVPTALRNVMDRLGSIKPEQGFSFDLMAGNKSVVHDIEIGEGLANMFTEETFDKFVGEDYRKQLDTMIYMTAPKIEKELHEVGRDCQEDVIDRSTSEIMLEVLDADIIKGKDYLDILTRLSELSEELVDTGRFEEILNIYNTIYSHAMTGKFKHEASSTIAYFFQSEAFLERIQNALILWGRKEREGAIRLTRALKAHLIPPLMDALSETGDPAIRKFILSLLAGIGNDAVPEAVHRLSDSRWYVVRNMLIIIRACGGSRAAGEVRKLAKHPDIRLSMEAVRTLLHFKTQDSVPYLKHYLTSKDERVREQAIVLAGAYRVKDAVPTLLEYIEKKDRLGSDASFKAQVVKALGEIGDKRAIEPLVRLLGTKVLMNRGPVEELKREIFRNLRNYEPASLKPLLEKGRRSNDEYIRTTSDSLIKRLFAKGGTR